ncbi:MAG: YceD family protein [Actinomycetes bacterium]
MGTVRSGRRLDPASPLVLDTRELGRRPGTMRRVQRTVPAPDGLGTDVIAVPPGEPLELDARIEAVQEGVLLSGTVTGVARGECVRCLEPANVDLTVDLQELYAYPDARPPGGRGSSGGGESEDDPLPELEGDLIDLEPVLRDAVVLALPFQPVCREECRGLCSECGARLDDDPEHQHDDVDPRWAALQQLIDDQRES